MNRGDGTLLAAAIAATVVGGACRRPSPRELGHPRNEEVSDDRSRAESAASAEATSLAASSNRQPACDSADQCFELSLELLSRSAPSLGDKEEALLAQLHGVEILRQGCVTRDANACEQLGQLHVAGLHVKKDITAGVRHIRTACELGSASACVELGHFLSVRARRGGHAVAPDRASALAAYKRACESGLDIGCVFAAAELTNTSPFEPGRIAARHQQEAAELYGRACELGEETQGCAPQAYLVRQLCDRDDESACATLDSLCRKAVLSRAEVCKR